VTQARNIYVGDRKFVHPHKSSPICVDDGFFRSIYVCRGFNFLPSPTCSVPMPGFSLTVVFRVGWFDVGVRTEVRPIPEICWTVQYTFSKVTKVTEKKFLTQLLLYRGPAFFGCMYCTHYIEYNSVYGFYKNVSHKVDFMSIKRHRIVRCIF
jgi:hypothetical protein